MSSTTESEPELEPELEREFEPGLELEFEPDLAAEKINDAHVKERVIVLDKLTFPNLKVPETKGTRSRGNGKLLTGNGTVNGLPEEYKNRVIASTLTKTPALRKRRASSGASSDSSPATIAKVTDQPTKSASRVPRSTRSKILDQSTNPASRVLGPTNRNEKPVATSQEAGIPRSKPKLKINPPRTGPFCRRCGDKFVKKHGSAPSQPTKVPTFSPKDTIAIESKPTSPNVKNYTAVNARFNATTKIVYYPIANNTRVAFDTTSPSRCNENPTQHQLHYLSRRCELMPLCTKEQLGEDSKTVAVTKIFWQGCCKSCRGKIVNARMKSIKDNWTITRNMRRAYSREESEYLAMLALTASKKVQALTDAMNAQFPPAADEMERTYQSVSGHMRQPAFVTVRAAVREQLGLT
ncbi:hypothetical protein LTS18_011990 [Coniosporium uncinatum]|uniref:Uncharacterized protein n=1 Tax=Coniosporium uncinatum TaxID=93489 RepID=A0ACC3DVV6_9PEZI|nr:hypothetical protein LTS18_011990 [Coniosporium uncinatum]